jgi:hypothetical protein
MSVAAVMYTAAELWRIRGGDEVDVVRRSRCASIVEEVDEEIVSCDRRSRRIPATVCITAAWEILHRRG